MSNHFHLCSGSRTLRGCPTSWSTPTPTWPGGALPWADPAGVSDRARQRGGGQLGSIGSGNHFVEVQRIDKVFDLHAAEALGLRSGQLVILVHTGSRGLGHQVCTDWVRSMDAVMARHGIQLPDRELACAPYESPEGKKYFQPPGMGSLAGSVRDRRWWLQFLSGVP